MKIDNPKSREHWRYQSIVNRCTFMVINLLIMSVFAVVGSDPLAALGWPLVVSILFAGSIGAFLVVWMILEIAQHLYDYLQGW